MPLSRRSSYCLPLVFAAGLQLGPLVMLLGGFLALSLVLAAYIESYVWLIMLGFVVGIGVLSYLYSRRNA